MFARVVQCMAAATFLISMFSEPVRADEVTLRAVNFLPPNATFAKPFLDWVDEVNARGRGKVQIEVLAAGSMSPFTMGNAVKTGAVDMGNIGPTFYQNLLPIGDATKLIQIGPQERRENGTLQFLNRLHNEKLNAHLLGMWGDGVQFHTYLRERPISEPDLNGYKMRITPIYRAFFRSLGADLIQMPPNDVFTALERGTVDGYGWPGDIVSFGWHRVTRYRVDPGFYQVMVAMLVNLEKWNSLSDEQREFLTTEAHRMIDEFPARAAAFREQFNRQEQEAGIEVIEFTGDKADRYVRQAYEAGWQEAMQLDEENGRRLRDLVSRPPE